ncbi:alpha/beta fold hydrolase [Falsiroseomonas tokyonensis]|uniref:Alpha/beta fold hydrolase n=1 Tax=Falsiroseomonas tokyonensis TaxID=430521 RepID=A0ABV7BRM2_9PROT|nr:alpha/beta fold hydrolase [Falsiroseomonas tokyonensis]MBU8536698.1 KR domain-containing protein [Falsiroseomonas tokyonensis]
MTAPPSPGDRPSPSLKSIIFRMVAEGEVGAVEAERLLRRLPEPAAKPPRDDAIAVIGMAGRFAGCADLDAYWTLLASGGDALSDAPASRWGAPAPGLRGGFLPDAEDFDPGFFRIAPAEAALIDPQQRLFLEQAWLALEDAGHAGAAIAGTRCGVFAGAGSGDYAHRFAGTPAAEDPLGLLGNVASILAARIAYHLNLKGPAIAVDTACSSSLAAIHLACESLRAGGCDLALAGGAAVISTPAFVTAMARGGAISPTGACHAFDAAADGFVPGEGAGVVVLKRLAEALADGDVIHGVIRASGLNQDGRTNGITAPSASAQAALEEAVWRQAGLLPAELDYVEAHGTGTPLGDPIELEGLCTALRALGGTKPGSIALGSAKAAIGHALTAAGVAGLLKLLLMLRHGTIPPQPHFAHPNPRLELDSTPFFVPRAARPWPRGARPRRAALSAFGFSGTNAHLLLEDPPAPVARAAEVAKPRLFLLSARSEAVLRRQAALLAEAPDCEARDLAFTLAEGRAVLPLRLATIAPDLATLRARLAAFSRDGAAEGVATASGAEAPGLLPLPAHAALADGAARFLQGGAVPGRAAAGDAAARRISLPSAPFARARHFLPPTGAPEQDLAAQGADFARVEAWGRQALAAAYAELGLFRGRAAHTPAGLARSLGIQPARLGLHQALLAMLERAGAVAWRDGLLRPAPGFVPASAATLTAARESLVAEAPAMAPFLALLARCTQNLPALLQGRITAPEILFPNGDMTLVEGVYRGNRLADQFNATLAETVVSLAKRHAAPRILEVGAGVGGATEGILAALGAAGLGAARYLYTDVSQSFLQAGRARFADRHAGFETAQFDLERDPEAQGLPAGGFDIVIAANVVHAMRGIGPALARLHRLVAPDGGALVLNEVTALQDFATLTFGLTDGWWAAEPGEARIPGSPLLDVAGWRTAFAAAGFARSSAQGLPGQTEEAGFGQAILVAQRDEPAVAPVAAPVAKPVVATPAMPAQGLLGAVLAVVAAALELPATQFERRDRFVDLGVDSLMGLKVVARLNARFGLDLRPTVLFDHPTPEALARHLGTLGLAAESTAQPVPAAAREATDNRIAVIGLSGRFGDSASLAEFHAMLAEGRAGITEAPAQRWTTKDLPAAAQDAAPYLRWGGFLRDADRFDPLFFRISGKEAELTDPQHRIFLTEAWRALEDAGYGEAALDGTRCGVFVGAHGGDYTHRMAQLDIVPEAFAFMGNAASILAARIAYVLNLKGPCLAVDTACSSSLVALHLACRSLVAGECEMALAGGAFITTTMGFNVAAAKAGMLSPNGRCHTFDAAADGFVPGEGAGVVVLKRLADALRDGDHIEAVILGSAVNQDGRTNGITAPSPESQSACIAEAQNAAGITPDAVTLIEAHGTGTPLGDPIEVEGLTRAFHRGACPPGSVVLGSVKTNIGHAAHAAGIAGFLKLVLQLRDRRIFASLNFRSENPHLRLAETPFAVATEARDWTVPGGGARIGGVSSFGFSGTNAHVVVAEAPPRAPAPTAAPPFLLLLSAKDTPALQRRAAQLAEWLEAHPAADLSDVAFTLAMGRSHFGQRLAVIGADRAALVAGLRGAPSSGSANLQARAARYLAGEEPDKAEWQGRRISLPSYPFAEQSYWIGAPPPAVTLFPPVWEDAPPTGQAAPGLAWLIGAAAGLAPALRAAGWRVVEVPPEADFAALLASGRPQACVLMPPVSPGAEAALRPLVALLQAVAHVAPRVLRLHHGTAEALAAQPLGASLAFTGTPVELRLVQVPPGAIPAPLVLAELAMPGQAPVAWSGESRRRERHLQALPAAADAAPLRRGGTFVISGGGGVLAGIFALEIARRTGGRIALLGRSDGTAMQDRLLALRTAGAAEAGWWQVDVTDAAAVAVTLREVRASFGPIHGVLHAAGVPGGAVLAEKDWPEIARVLAPKIQGARALDAATAQDPLDVFAAFGSLAAELGDFGQGDYAMANAFLAAFAEERAAAGRPGRSVTLGWPLWREGRRVLSTEGEAVFLKTAGLPPLETEAGLAAFHAALAHGSGAYAVMPGDAAAAARFFAPPPPSRTEPAAMPAIAEPAPADLAEAERRLTTQIAKLLHIDTARIGRDIGFAEFGFDSIALKEFAAVLSDSWGVAVTPAVFFAHGTVAALARHLVETHGATAPVAKPIVVEARPAPPVVAQPAAQEPIAIIGLSGRFPGAPDLDAFWRRLEAAEDMTGPLPAERLAWQPHVTPDATLALRGGFLENVEDFDPGFFRLSLREAVHMDPQHRLALEAAWLCVEDAGLRMSDLAGRDIGVFFGAQVNDYAALLPAAREEARAQITLGNIAAMLPNRISFLFDLRGPSEAVDTACSSALVALHRAARAVAHGECEMALAGGVSLMLSVESLASTQRLGILAPDGICRAFDAEGRGYVKGEGVGCVLLKPLSRALADGDPVQAVILGSAEGHGGRAQSLTAPNALAQSAVIQAAIRRAGITSDSIGWVEAHGTGTELGDPVEALALRQAFAATAGDVVAEPRCRIGALKPSLGHLEPASGIAGLIKVVLAMRHRIQPATRNFARLNPHVDLAGSPLEMDGRMAAWAPLRAKDGTALPRRAGVSAFGFGGSNAHVVLQEAPPVPPAASPTKPLLLLVSARDTARLAEMLTALAQYARAQGAALDAQAMADTLMLGREPMAARAAVLLRPGEDAAARLDAARAALLDAAATRDAIWLGTAPEATAPTPQAEAAMQSEMWAAGQLAPLAALWVQGTALDFGALLGPGRRRVPLPGTRFARQRCWFDHPAAAAPIAAVAAPPVAAAPVTEALPALADTPDLRQALRKMVARALYLEPEAIGTSTGFGDLGVDSILAVELTREVNATFGTSLQAARLYDYATIDALADHLAGSAPAAPAAADDTAEELRRLLAAALFLEPADLDPQASFGDLGLDSILAVEFTRVVNDRFGLSLSAARLYDHANLAALAAHLRGLRAGASPAAPLTGRAAEVLDFLRARLPDGAACTAATPLAEIALEPEAAMALLEALNQRFGCALAAEEVGRCADLGALARLVASRTPPDPPPPSRAEPPAPEPGAAAPPPRPEDQQRVAIIGFACRLPGAPDAEAFWSLLAEGRDAVTAMPEEPWREAIYRRILAAAQRPETTPWAGTITEVDRFDAPFFGLSPQEAALMDPQQRLFLESAWHALEDAGQTPERLAGTACGIFVGCGQGDYSQLLPRDPAQISGLTLLGNAASILAARLAYVLDLQGPALAVDTACSSALVATHLARRSILDGECEMALAGGVSLMLTPQMQLMTGAAGMLSATGRCRPFDATADGFVPGEGVGVVVLKRLDLARRDGDAVLAIIEGSGTNQDGRTASLTAPSAASQVRLLRSVHARHGIDTATIGLVEAHGTGTQLGDPMEMSALAEVFGSTGDCALGSVKGNIGHTLAASGVAGLIKLLLALRHQTIPASLHCTRPNPHFALSGTPFRIATETQPWPAPPDGAPRRAAISAFGFSGTNAHLVLAEDASSVSNAAVARELEVVVLSARDTAALDRAAAALADWLARHPEAALGDIAYTLARRRAAFAERRAFVVANLAELRAALVGNPPQRAAGPLHALAARWQAGEAVDWAPLMPAGRVPPLPGYRFARTRHWVEPVAVPAADPVPLRPRVAADPGVEKLCALVAAQLRVEAVAPDAPFGTLGLDSVAAIALMQTAERDFGVRLPPIALWDHPTPARLAAFIARQPPAPRGGWRIAMAEGDNPLVPIRDEGEGPAWIFVHGGSGDLHWLPELAHHLGPDQRVFGLEALGLDCQAAPLPTVEAMAAHYVAALRRSGIAEPFRLGGYSGGGAIAFEMARQLLAAGQAVEKLVLLDANAPGSPALLDLQSSFGPGYIHLVAGNWLGARWGMRQLLVLEDLAGLDGPAALDHVVAHLRQHATPPLPKDELRRQLAAMDRIGWAIGDALRAYRPAPLTQELEVLLFECRDGLAAPGNLLGLPDTAATRGYREGWQALFAGPITRIPIDCDHFALLQGENGRRIGQILAPPTPTRLAKRG